MTISEITDVLSNYKNIIPVPVADIARDLAIKVFMVHNFPDKKSGEIRKTEAGYEVRLNSKHPYTRNRFTLAHEIAHLNLHKTFLDRQKNLEEFDGMTYALSRDKNSLGKKEWEADMLAGEILMPKDEFIKIWNQGKTISEVANIFDVSEGAAYTRAKVLASELHK